MQITNDSARIVGNEKGKEQQQGCILLTNDVTDMGSRERMIMIEVDGMEIATPRRSTRKTRNGGRKAPKEKFDFEKESVSMPFKPIGEAYLALMNYKIEMND